MAAFEKEAGFSISVDDLKNSQSELSDEELEGVTGGGLLRLSINFPFACVQIGPE